MNLQVRSKALDLLEFMQRAGNLTLARIFKFSDAFSKGSGEYGSVFVGSMLPSLISLGCQAACEAKTP